MSAAALVMLSREPELSSKKTSKSLRVNQPGDTFEQEADRVADTVSAGGRVPGWSLASTGADQIQRDSNTASALPPAQPVPQIVDSQDPPQSNNYGDMLGKIAEAFLKTSTGKAILNKVTDDPLVEGAKDFVQTPQGIVVGGSTAIAAITGLAAAHKGLPAQIPAIPLDKVLPGLKMKIDVEGPLNHPTQGSLMFSFEGAPPRKKKGTLTDKERFQAETARMAADQQKFRKGLAPHSQGPLASPEAQQQQANEQLAYKAEIHRLGSILQPGATHKPGEFTPLVPDAQPLSLHMRDADRIPAADATNKEKKEEIPVQRKAESTFYDEQEAAPEVESVITSSGRPLDYETRRYMESRIGFDFSRVRIHTGSRAAASARSLGAHAYTVSNSIVFGSGGYAPQTSAGRRLLAHELTHVVQQSAPPQKPHPVIHGAPHHVQRLAGINVLPNLILDKLRGLKVYPLICVVIGQDLINDTPVERTPTTLLKAVLDLFENGPALYEKLAKAGDSLKKAYDWVLTQFIDLHLTLNDFSELLTKVRASVHVLSPFDSWDKVKELLRTPYDNLVELAKRLGKAALNFILEGALSVFGDTGRKVYAFFQKAGNVLGRIAADPLKFAKNLFAVVQLGFKNFADHILDYLGEGVKTWIFEELDIKGVTIPKEFTFASMLKLFLEVLGLTYDQKRPLLVEKLTEPAVYFFETTGKVLDRVRKEGLSAIWSEIKKGAESILDSLLGNIKDWIAKEVVEKAVIIVASLANPVGELVEAVRSIYETVEFVIEKAAKLVDLIKTVLDALSDIVDGVIAPAAQKVTAVLARSIPLILHFLTDLLHLGGIGKSIHALIDKVRTPINNVIGLVLDKIVTVAKPIWDKAKESFLAGLQNLKEWWTKPSHFSYGDEQHEIKLEGDGEHPDVFIHSETKSPLRNFLKDVKATPTQTATILALAKKLHWRQGEVSPSAAAKGKEDYDALTKAMAGLKARKAPPATLKNQVEWPATGGGKRADAFLSANHKLGTDPRGKEPPMWTDLGYLLEKKNYKRGHLLSNRLGGQGEWFNLMPLTNKSNGEMSRQVETPLIEAIADGTRFFHYVVTADYKDVTLPAPTQLELKDKAAKQNRAQKAEERLVELRWTVTPAKLKGNKLMVDEGGTLTDANDKPLPSTVASGSIDPKKA